MTRKSAEFFAKEYLPALEKYTSYLRTSRALGLNQNTVFVWINASRAAKKRGDTVSEFLFEYQDEGPKWFHQWVLQCQRTSGENIEANFMDRLEHGYYRPCRFQGKTVWADDPKLVGVDDETLEMLGLPDRLLRVNGEVQPELEWIPVGVDGTLAYLQSHRNKWSKQQTVNVNNRMGGGVMIANQQPRIAAPLPMLEIVQDIIADDPAPEAGDDAGEPEAVDGPGDDLDFSDVPEPLPPPAASPVIREPTPAKYQSEPSPLLTPLQRDLQTRLRALQAKPDVKL